MWIIFKENYDRINVYLRTTTLVHH